ncbi:hypothetical protein BTO32_14760 [Marinobacter lutaoensis]|uniref:Uncharacterized protein n=1 Tax=Marinobacter lutaoensis TaxID=135739 RepID=A0A1V2DPC2_9GAMM|nr:hypothetical protein [Marinobacter lutaoensis]ONF42472.1 hypothetical protein BTO32_14760 [Marinobacter lutaoensis]
MPEETFENGLERGYPIHVSPDAFIATAEQMLRIRAANRGIREVAIKDANVPIAGAFRHDTLMPVMVDYMNAVILPHSELKFESAMNDEVTARVAAGMAAEQRREPEVKDVLAASEMVSEHLTKTPLYNAESEAGGLGVETRLRTYASTPLSVTLLILDTALESAHTLSMRHQQSSLGIAEPDVLDLTPVCELLSALPVAERLVSIPERLQREIDRVLRSETAEPTENTYDALDATLSHQDHNIVPPGASNGME